MKDSDDEDGSGNSDDAGENEECDSPEIDPTQAALNFKYEELSDKICNVLF